MPSVLLPSSREAGENRLNCRKLWLAGFVDTLRLIPLQLCCVSKKITGKQMHCCQC